MGLGGAQVRDEGGPRVSRGGEVRVGVRVWVR